MDDKLKYRLVGATVILALGVFFLPLILDSEKYRTKIVSQIPAMPQASKERIEQINHIQADKVAESGPLVIQLDEEPQDSTAQSHKTPQPPVNQQLKPSSEDKTADDLSKEPVDTVEQAKEVKEALKKEQTPERVEKQPQMAKNTDIKAEKEKEKMREVAQTTPAAPEFKETAWLIQLATFSQKENATKLVSNLRNEGFRAYQRTEGNFTKVYVGPYPDKKAAESRKQALEKVVGNSVKVIEFDAKAH